MPLYLNVPLPGPFRYIRQIGGKKRTRPRITNAEARAVWASRPRWYRRFVVTVGVLLALLFVLIVLG